MNFGFTEEQDLLRTEVRKLLDARCSLPEVRKLMESQAGYSAGLWSELAELGWLGLTIPEAHGGAGLGWVDFVVLLEETGRSLFPSPLVSTTLAAAAILDSGSEEQRARWLPGIADGSRIGTLVLDGARVPKSALLGAPGRAWPAIERLFDRGAIATTGEMIGAAEGALALTVQYAKDRIQFGNPIGKYQGVKHPLAEMYVDVESTKSLLYYAAWALDESPREVPRSASLAKAYASDAFARIGIDGVQLHGAVGYTAEYDIQLFLKRSKWARPTFGDSDFHYERVASLGGL